MGYKWHQIIKKLTGPMFYLKKIVLIYSYIVQSSIIILIVKTEVY